ncbi:MAG: DUF2225 domain-containing protein [Anaerolineales bacterium]|nr:DUF2225 domain-containing protein [Anaerolineales bacterium]
MADPITLKLRCPNCGEEFEDVFAGVIHLSGMGFKADFEPGFVSDAPITELLLYQCNQCGFTERSIPERFDEPISADLQKFSEEALPKIWKKSSLNSSSPSSKFENYAQYLEFSGARLFDIGKAYLRASWINNSDECRELALGYFENAVSAKDTIGSAEAPIAAYLGGEMARKLEKYLTAERLYHVANKLSSKSPELAIRTYSFLLEMSHRQSTAPSDEPIWNFSDGLILDPLDYYHGKILTSIGIYYRYTQQQSAVALYDRAYNLCKPAIERIKSSKTPKILFNGDEYLTGELLKLSLAERRMGFWADDCLVMMGLQSLSQLKNLKSIIQDSTLIERIEVESKAYATEMQELEGALKKHYNKRNRPDEQQSYQVVDERRIEKRWNIILFFLFGLVTILASSALTFYGLEALKIYKYWLLIFGGTAATWLIWGLGQRLLEPAAKLIGRISKRDGYQHPIVKYVIPLVVFLGGVVFTVVYAGWPAIVSVGLSIILVLGLNLIIRLIKNRRLRE